MLALIAVPCSMLGISPGSQGETPKAEIGMLLGAPPKVLDFTEYIDDEQGERKDERLYFSPLQFPTPVDLNEAGKCASFQALKTYIKHASQKAGSPVTSRTACGGYKVFLCQHSQKCNYQFWVKWDSMATTYTTTIMQQLHTLVVQFTTITELLQTHM